MPVFVYESDGYPVRLLILFGKLIYYYRLLVYTVRESENNYFYTDILNIWRFSLANDDLNKKK